ncbi:hypothetical protein [Limnobaculum xujianqingii]|uniref:hypothetical protein n=1 Tax=Limnobaculum xujianqingii TaxID=2738837 RepID=UPI001E2DC968|nr:hypothetical protein [Limnobaculum xujianqingii]
MAEQEALGRAPPAPPRLRTRIQVATRLPSSFIRAYAPALIRSWRSSASPNIHVWRATLSQSSAEFQCS